MGSKRLTPTRVRKMLKMFVVVVVVSSRQFCEKVLVIHLSFQTHQSCALTVFFFREPWVF